MTVEVKQMTIKSTVSHEGENEHGHADLKQLLEEMKAEILAECQESLEQRLRQERER